MNALLELLPQLNDMILILDEEDCIIGISAGVQKYWGDFRENWVGRRYAALHQELGLSPIPDLTQNHIETINRKGQQAHWQIFSHPPYKILVSHAAQLAEQHAHATDIYLESILMSSPSNIYWLDREGRAIGCNDQAVKHLGLKSREDAIGKTVFDVAKILNWDEETAQKIREEDLRIMQTHECTISREVVLVKDEQRTYLASKSPLLNKENEAIGILGISTDITPQVRIEKELEIAKEKAEASSRAKSQFIANISHDIRTPLAGILGVAEDLRTRLSEEYQSDMYSLIEAGEGLLTLLNSVMELSQSEQDMQAIPMAPFNLYAMVNQIKTLFVPTAAHKGLTVEVAYDPAVPRHVVGKLSLLQRAVLNLTGNALKFTERGGMIIHVMPAPDFPVNSAQMFPVQIIVEDTGLGIAKNKLTQIFKQFYQITPTYIGKYKGNGLGLSIAKQFIAHLGGKMWAESELGRGSRFYIQLPLLIPDESTVVSTRTHIDQDLIKSLTAAKQMCFKPIKWTDKRILLVEDHQVIRKTTANLFKRLGCVVDTAKTAMEAIEFASAHAYDLIYLDIGLPDHDGFWVAQQIRQLPGHEHTPIIALTAHISSTSYRQQCLNAGMNGVLSKPITQMQVEATLQAIATNACNQSDI
jgi:two-component system, OmpR family, aerobic respiration control sensor histidine kinase ArcB